MSFISLKNFNIIVLLSFYTLNITLKLSGLNSKHVLFSFYSGSGIQKRLTWVALAQSPSLGCSYDVGRCCSLT